VRGAAVGARESGYLGFLRRRAGRTLQVSADGPARGAVGPSEHLVGREDADVSEVDPSPSPSDPGNATATVPAGVPSVRQSISSLSWFGCAGRVSPKRTVPPAGTMPEIPLVPCRTSTGGVWAGTALDALHAGGTTARPTRSPRPQRQSIPTLLRSRNVNRRRSHRLPIAESRIQCAAALVDLPQSGSRCHTIPRWKSRTSIPHRATRR
jgi:hypothetical protein